jgi:hypothetical protein
MFVFFETVCLFIVFRCAIGKLFTLKNPPQGLTKKIKLVPIGFGRWARLFAYPVFNILLFTFRFKYLILISTKKRKIFWTQAKLNHRMHLTTPPPKKKAEMIYNISLAHNLSLLSAARHICIKIKLCTIWKSIL